MSALRFEPMTEEMALRILQARDYSLDTMPDRIRARRVVARCYSDSGESPPPLRGFYSCTKCRGRGRAARARCSLCGGLGYTEDDGR